jgi:hypothetical protein
MSGTGGAVGVVAGPISGTVNAGQNATNYGGGGSGSTKTVTSSASPVAGLGFSGIVIIEEFY